MLLAMSEKKYNQLYFYMLIFVAATLCYPTINAINNIGIIILGLVWIAEGRWSEKWHNFTQNKIILLTAGFFLFHLMGLLYTQNLNKGFNIVLDYVPLLVFALVLCTIPPLDKRHIQTIIAVFVFSCFLATLLCLGNAIRIHFSPEALAYTQYDYWFYDLLTRPIQLNSIYFSLYLGFCVFAIGYYLFEYHYKLTLLKKAVLILWIVYFLGIMLLLTSRTTLITTFFLGAINYVLFVIQKKKTLHFLLPVVLCPVFALVFILNSSFLSDRFLDITNLNIEAVAKDQQQRQSVHLPWTSSSAIRIAIWKSSVEIMEDNFFTGVGTGDTQDELVKMYNKNNYIFDKEYRHHNAHNQFIQTMLTIGVVGLLLLLGIFMVSFWQAWQQRSYFYMTFLVYIALNCLTESLLQRQKGIVFFSLINFLIFFYLDYQTRLSDQKALAVKAVA